ncbi:MAG: DNA-3-methyladenine glycosylase [Thermoanaerobaculia bacterium]
MGKPLAESPRRPRDSARFVFRPSPPYSLARTAARFTRWPEAVDRFDGRTYRRLLPLGRSGLLVEVSQVGSARQPALSVRLRGAQAATPAARRAAERVVRIGLGAGLDARPFLHAFRDDALLGPLLARFRGLRIAGAPSLWEAIVTAVLSQQVSLIFAYNVRRELALAFGARRRLGGELFVAFPTPDAIARQTLRGLRRFRLSGAKAAALRRLGEEFASGELSEEAIERLPDEEAIEKLVELKGVGRWTAEIALLRGQGRADVFPGGDLGVVKYLAVGLLGHSARVTEREMREFAERWRPYRGLALMYAYAEINRRAAKKNT